MSAEPCSACGKTGGVTKPVNSLTVWAPLLPRPHPMLPAEEYVVCLKCDSLLHFVRKAIAANQTTAKAGRWTHALAIFDDGSGYTIHNPAVEEAPTQKAANA